MLIILCFITEFPEFNTHCLIICLSVYRSLTVVLLCTYDVEFIVRLLVPAVYVDHII